MLNFRWQAGQLKVGELFVVIFQSLRDVALPIKIIVLSLEKSFLNSYLQFKRLNKLNCAEGADYTYKNDKEI